MNLSSTNQYRKRLNGQCHNSIKSLVNLNPDGFNEIWMEMDH